MRHATTTRRTVLLAAVAAASARTGAARAQPSRRPFDAAQRLRALEAGAARLGVCLLNTASGEYTGNRLDERFAMCSTFKLAMVAACLREADAGRLDLAEVLPYSEADLLSWAPVTGEHVRQGGLSIRVLAQAAQEVSDGTAANLLVRRLGGPAAVTAKFREMGDRVTRLDRYEPDLGITTGRLLSRESRELLLGWMVNTKTGMYRLRAGLPPSWRTGDKTGTGRAEGTTNKCNDVAITFPPDRAPVIIAAYFDSGEYTPQTERRHEAVLAEVGKIAAEWAVG